VVVLDHQHDDRHDLGWLPEMPLQHRRSTAPDFGRLATNFAAKMPPKLVAHRPK
jgi:hypothetical protein